MVAIETIDHTLRSSSSAPSLSPLTVYEIDLENSSPLMFTHHFFLSFKQISSVFTFLLYLIYILAVLEIVLWRSLCPNKGLNINISNKFIFLYALDLAVLCKAIVVCLCDKSPKTGTQGTTTTGRKMFVSRLLHVDLQVHQPPHTHTHSSQHTPVHAKQGACGLPILFSMQQIRSISSCVFSSVPDLQQFEQRNTRLMQFK